MKNRSVVKGTVYLLPERLPDYLREQAFRTTLSSPGFQTPPRLQGTVLHCGNLAGTSGHPCIPWMKKRSAVKGTVYLPPERLPGYPREQPFRTTLSSPGFQTPPRLQGTVLHSGNLAGKPDDPCFHRPHFKACSGGNFMAGSCRRPRTAFGRPLMVSCSQYGYLDGGAGLSPPPRTKPK